MLIDEACVACIINQSVKVANAIGADNGLKSVLTSAIEDMSKDFSYQNNPPEIAADVYEKMSLLANKADLYDVKKALATKKALSFIPFLEEKLLNSDNKLLTATKIAVAGNVIDLAAAVEFDLAYTRFNETRVEQVWLDLFFESPSMNRVEIRDITLSRHPRAEL